MSWSVWLIKFNCFPRYLTCSFGFKILMAVPSFNNIFSVSSVLPFFGECRLVLFSAVSFSLVLSLLGSSFEFAFTLSWFFDGFFLEIFFLVLSEAVGACSLLLGFFLPLLLLSLFFVSFFSCFTSEKVHRTQQLSSSSPSLLPHFDSAQKDADEGLAAAASLLSSAPPSLPVGEAQDR